MIGNCRGCVYEFEEAIRFQEGYYNKKRFHKSGIGQHEKYYFATSKRHEAFVKGKHFYMWMVDCKGREAVW